MNRPATILVATDDDAVRAAIVDSLRRAGHDTTEAADGFEAIAQAAKTPDLIILDVNMPGKSGYEVCDAIRANAGTRSLPVIMLTANDKEDADRIRGFEHGATAFLTWPVEPTVLVAHITSIITARSHEQRLSRWVTRCTPLGGEAFYRAAVTFLAEELGADFAIIGRIDPGPEEIVRALAASVAGELQPSLEYPLDGTPCARLAEQGFCVHPDGVCELFPEDKALIDLGARGYAGMPLVDRDGQSMGIIAIASRAPLTQLPLVESVLRLVADRAETELLRTRSEEILRAQQERLERAVRSGSVGLWDWDIASGALDWNDQVKHIFGFPLDATDITLEQYIAAIHPEDSEETQRCFRQALEDRAEYRSEHRIIRSDGAVRWILAVGRGVYDADGNPTHLRGAVVDITDRKAAEAGLREQLEWNQTMLRTMVDGFILADLERRILETNPSYRRMVGYTEEELVGRNIREIENELDPDEVTERIETFKRDRRAQFETRHRHKDGHDVHLQVSINLVGTPPNAHVAAFVRDITDRKKAEVQIARLNRTYAVLSDINQLIVRERDEKILLESACTIAVRKGGFALAWIGTTDDSGRLKIAAHAGADQDTARALHTLVEGEKPNCPTTFAALSSGRYAVCNDIVATPHPGPWQQAALARGYRSMISLPLIVFRQTIGTYNLYSESEDFFDREEITLLDELSRDIAFALESAELDRRRRLAETRQQQFSRILEAIALDRPLSHILGEIAHALEILRPGIRVAIHRVRTDGQLHLAAARNLPDPIAPAFQTIPLPADNAHLLTEAGNIVERPADDPLVAPLTEQLGPEAPGAFWWRMITGPDGSAMATFTIAASTQAQLDGETSEIIDAAAHIAGIAVQRYKEKETLRRSEERFREFAETVREIFWIARPRLAQVLYVSPAFETIWGKPCRALYDNPRCWLEAIHPDDQPGVLRAVEERMPAGSYNETYRIIRPDGEVRWIHDQAYPVHDANGEVTRVVGVARDITDQRQLEEQLRQSQKLEAVGQLAGGIAHDFNNILAAILMQATVVAEEDDLPEEAREGIAEINLSARRAADLVRQLLLFSRRQVLQPRQLDVNASIQHLASMLRRVIPENIELRLELHDHPLWVQADPAMLDQILVNLTVNARDAMPEGGTVTVRSGIRELDEEGIRRLSHEAQPGAYVWFQVADTGPGIPEAIRPRLFEPFFTTKEPGQGTGLGLATVFGIVQQHHGWITVESEPGHGATFTVGLPAAKPLQESRPQNRSTPKTPGGDETILLVEDHENVRRVTVRLLNQKGYRILEAECGEQALEIWKEHAPQIDLLLTDLVMPGALDGASLAARLRRDRPELPVIYTSGYTDEVSSGGESDGKNTVFLPKPCPPHTFLKTIRTLLDNSRHA